MFQRVPALILAMLALPTLHAGAADVESTIQQLAKIRLNRAQIYSVRDITLDRDVLSITLNRGTLAFTEALDGKVTGAVFIGSGDILAIPPNSIERGQLFRYTKSALLAEHFETAVFRFTDGSYEDILKEYRSHAPEDVDPSDRDQVLRWESELQRRGAFLNDRLLTDLLGERAHPFFLAQIEGAHLGWFDAVYDESRVEEIFVQQTTRTGTPVVWLSFDKRAEARDPAAAAHEDKSTFDLVSANEAGTEIRVKLKADGERVIDLPVASTGIKGVSLENGTSIRFLSSLDHVSVVLPELSRSNQSLVFHLEYAPDAVLSRPVRTPPPGALSPASYRDGWIIDGLAGYATGLSTPGSLAQAKAQLLAESPSGGTYESLGPLWIGYRVLQSEGSAAALAAYQGKSRWVVHMLRNVLEHNRSEPVFAQFLEETFSQFASRPISTFDFKKLAEKYAGKSLDWFFDDWVFGTGVPAYTVNARTEVSAGGFVISGSITQSEVPDTFEMPVPLYADDALLGYVTVSSAGGEFRFVSRTRPQQILVDPGRTILARDGQR